MSMIIQTFEASGFIPSIFQNDTGIKVDAEANFCLDEGEKISKSFNFNEIRQTSRMKTGAPHLGPDSYVLHNWTLSFTQKRILIWSPNIRHKTGIAGRIEGCATGGYLRYFDIAALSAVNFTDKKLKEGRIEICSRGNAQKGGVEIFTIIGTEKSALLEDFAYTLTEKLLDWWGDRVADTEFFQKEEFGKRLKEFAALNWQAVVDEKDYLRGLGIYKDEEEKVWARWREALPPAPTGSEAVFRNIFEFREEIKGRASILTGKKYEKKSWGTFYDKE